MFFYNSSSPVRLQTWNQLSQLSLDDMLNTHATFNRHSGQQVLCPLEPQLPSFHPKSQKKLPVQWVPANIRHQIWHHILKSRLRFRRLTGYGTSLPSTSSTSTPKLLSRPPCSATGCHSKSPSVGTPHAPLRLWSHCCKPRTSDHFSLHFCWYWIWFYTSSLISLNLQKKCLLYETMCKMMQIMMILHKNHLIINPQSAP